MTIVEKPSDHPSFSKKIGILLVNLGTPDFPDPKSLRKYLKEFLSDQRVIDIPKILWWFILNLIILNTRPKKSAQAYSRIWIKDDPDGSPLKIITRKTIEKLSTFFHDDICVLDYAMRYGNPSIKSKLDYLKNMNCSKILVFNLYPQYAAPTTATVNDEVCKWLIQQKWQPTIRFSSPYFDDNNYINAVTNSIKESFKKDGVPEILLMSFHGSPKRYLIEGDPYHCHCMKTARLIKERLKLNEKNFLVTFQSRFGSEPWLQPYTDESLKSLGEKKIKHLSVITPGFSTDNLETLEEINIEGREIFKENGGGKFTFIPCLNESKNGIKLLKDLLNKEISGWI